MEGIRGDWLVVAWVAAVAMGLISAWRGRGEYLRGRGGYLRVVFPGKQRRVVRVTVGQARAVSYGYRRR